jgi:hypothetical protein
MPQISTPYDVQRNSTIGKDVSIDIICQFLGQIEEGIFNNTSCLGWEFYEFLQNDLFVITPSPVFFQANTPYLIGVYVQFAGEIYEVIDTTSGLETPINTNYFKRPSKFINPNNNNIWDNYLIKIIAINVQITSYLDGATPYTPLGLIKNETETTRPATSIEITHKTQNLKSFELGIIKNLESFLDRNKDLYKCSNSCKCREEIMKPQRHKLNSFYGIQL